ncbi:unnamed protein product [Cuscuta epithymum]|uniref:RNase H type-1 domain-containing protein n=1 Tax=Cuscuta epithymum TaxID=186058 RepID=A0AAV0F4V1_9ASTE|nr:unnamed protein product [Cuscuta epithymum]
MEWLETNFQSSKEEEFYALVMGCWGIWFERNKRVWQGIGSNARQIVARTRAYFEGWCKAQQRGVYSASSNLVEQSAGMVSWRRPMHGIVKLNVDASLTDSRCGLGWVLRNDQGEFLAGGACPELGGTEGVPCRGGIDGYTGGS